MTKWEIRRITAAKTKLEFSIRTSLAREPSWRIEPADPDPYRSGDEARSVGLGWWSVSRSPRGIACKWGRKRIGLQANGIEARLQRCPGDRHNERTARPRHA